MTRPLAVLACLLAAGCAGSHGQGPSIVQQAKPLPQTAPVTLDAKQTAALHAGVRKVMKDPESARFGRHVAGRDPEGTIVVCGMVNGKNSYGGYTGEKPYMAEIKAGNVGVIGIGAVETEVSAYFTVCRQQGLVL